MEYTRITGKYIDDDYQLYRHPTGLDIYIYPKKSCQSTYAMFGTKYGSIDNCFKRSDESVEQAVPAGIAHFLEHKLFESEDGDAFSRFGKTGASANAFTSFDSTCYLFSCTENAYENLEILLDFVQSPYFTAETVKKEQGIIAQEIKMYDDDPNWQIMVNLLGAMYFHHPVKEDIAGTVESIAQITPELLYRCYHTFYNLHNMALCIAGNIETESVLAICDKMLRPCQPIYVDRVFAHEPSVVVEPYVETRMPVALPSFQMGYKLDCPKEGQREEDIAAVSILLDLLASDASPLFRRLLEKGLINEASFSYDFFEGAGYASILIGGESNNPKQAAAEIQSEISHLKEQGIGEEAFLRSKKTLYGEMISSLNSPASICNSLTSYAFRNLELFRLIDTVVDLPISAVENKLNTLFHPDRFALSVVLPLNNQGEKK